MPRSKRYCPLHHVCTGAASSRRDRPDGRGAWSRLMVGRVMSKNLSRRKFIGASASDQLLTPIWVNLTRQIDFLDHKSSLSKANRKVFILRFLSRSFQTGMRSRESNFSICGYLFVVPSYPIFSKSNMRCFTIADRIFARSEIMLLEEKHYGSALR